MWNFIPMILEMVQGANKAKKAEQQRQPAGAQQAPAAGGGGMGDIIGQLGKGGGQGSLAPQAAPSNLSQGNAMGLAQEDPWDKDAFGDAGY